MGTPTASSTTTFTTPLSISSGVNDSGIESTGSWSGPVDAFGRQAQVLEQIPSPIMPVLPVSTNPTVIQVSPNSFKAYLSLSGAVDPSTLQLNPSFTNAHGTPVTAVSPNVFGFVFTSRNSHVCTVSPSGLVTAVGRGEVCILVSSARAANLPFAGASAPAGLTGCEVACELNVVVLA